MPLGSLRQRITNRTSPLCSPRQRTLSLSPLSLSLPSLSRQPIRSSVLPNRRLACLAACRTARPECALTFSKQRRTTPHARFPPCQRTHVENDRERERCKDSERNRESSLASEQQEGHKRRARQAAPQSHQRARLTWAECRGYARHAPRACGAASDTQSPRGAEPLATPSTRTHTHTLIYHLHTPSHRLQ